MLSWEEVLRKYNKCVIFDPLDIIMPGVDKESEYRKMVKKNIFVEELMNNTESSRVHFMYSNLNFDFSYFESYQNMGCDSDITILYQPQGDKVIFHYEQRSLNCAEILIREVSEQFFQGYVCDWETFLRFIIFNCLRVPEKWIDVTIRRFLSTNVNIVNTILAYTWLHPNVKMHNRLEIAVTLTWTDGVYTQGALNQGRQFNRCALEYDVKERMKAMLMVTHPRLGADSPGNVLCVDVLELIGKHVMRI